MTTKMLDETWAADPAQPGRIECGNAIQIDIRNAGTFGCGAVEAMRLVKEAEAIVLAAPAMAKALLLNGRRNPDFEDSAWHTHDCWDNRRASCSEACKATVAALAAAGIAPP